MMLKEMQEKKLHAPDAESWNRQLHRAYLFDDLVANIDENAGNLLFDRQWNFIKVDHSRAFTDTQALPFPIGQTGGHGVLRIDRQFFERAQGARSADGRPRDRRSARGQLPPGALRDGETRS